jgi:hypothetical protein
MTKNGKNAIEWDTLSADQLIDELAGTLSLSLLLSSKRFRPLSTSCKEIDT